MPSVPLMLHIAVEATDRLWGGTIYSGSMDLNRSGVWHEKVTDVVGATEKLANIWLVFAAMSPLPKLQSQTSANGNVCVHRRFLIKPVNQKMVISDLVLLFPSTSLTSGHSFH